MTARVIFISIMIIVAAVVFFFCLSSLVLDNILNLIFIRRLSSRAFRHCEDHCIRMRMHAMHITGLTYIVESDAR